MESATCPPGGLSLGSSSSNVARPMGRLARRVMDEHISCNRTRPPTNSRGFSKAAKGIVLERLADRNRLLAGRALIVGAVGAAILAAAVGAGDAAAATRAQKVVLYSVAEQEQYIDNSDSLTLGQGDNPFGNFKDVSGVTQKNSHGPFPGDEAVFSFNLYKDAKPQDASWRGEFHVSVQLQQERLLRRVVSTQERRAPSSRRVHSTSTPASSPWRSRAATAPTRTPPA